MSPAPKWSNCTSSFSPAFTDPQKAHFECNKRLATSAVLLSKNATPAGIEMLELLLRHTQYFEFTDLTLQVLCYLRLHDGTIAGKPFKPGKFLNETPEFSKDKPGRNIPVLLARMLYLLAQQEQQRQPYAAAQLSPAIR